VHRRLSALSSFYRHAAGAAGNPVEGAARPAAPDPASDTLSTAEAARLWAAACRLGPKTASLVGLVLLDGLKTSEVLPLDVGDVRFGRATATVAIQRRDAPTPVAAQTAVVLRRYVGPRRSGPLFVGDNPTRDPARLTRFGVDYLVKRAGAEAGLDAPLTVNTLRRSSPATR
jgi:integrase